MAPSILPVLGLVISVVLLINPVADQDATVLLITVVLLAVGAALWLVTRILAGRARSRASGAGTEGVTGRLGERRGVR